jgi:hypothetical protein
MSSKGRVASLCSSICCNCFFVSGKIPLAATRCYRSWDNLTRTFGRNTTLSWDLFPTGSRQPYTYIEIITCDGQRLRYERISKGTGYADAVYERRATATPFLGSRFSWNGNGWDLKLRDGSLNLCQASVTRVICIRRKNRTCDANTIECSPNFSL